MNEEDREIMDMLLKDKGQIYRVVVDNDSVWVEVKPINKNIGNVVIHTFNNYGWEFIVEIMNYLGLCCEPC